MFWVFHLTAKNWAACHQEPEDNVKWWRKANGPNGGEKKKKGERCVVGKCQRRRRSHNISIPPMYGVFTYPDIQSKLLRRSFRYILGIQMPSSQVFRCLGYIWLMFMVNVGIKLY